MALQIKHKIVPNNSNRNIVFTETTGVYSSTNPTGYGATQTPTGFREIVDILNSNLKILTVNGTVNFIGGSTPTVIGEVYSTSYNNTNAQLIANGTPQNIDLGTLIPEEYVDGVYKSYYYNWFTGQGTVSTNTGNTLIVSNTTEFAAGNYINIIILDVSYNYEIVSVDPDSLTITINGTVPVDLTLVNSYKVGYTSTAYFANTFSINKCLHSRISKLAISSCSCNNGCTEKLYEAVMLYMAIQPNMDLGKYQKAQDIIEYLNNYCNDGCCNC
jgi:hypothetical protein